MAPPLSTVALEASTSWITQRTDMRNLYIYVDGFDLFEVEAPLMSALRAFVDRGDIPNIRIINDRKPSTPDLEPGEWPEWKLGLNVEFEKLSAFQIDSPVAFFQSLAEQTGRDFAVGLWEPLKNRSEDLCFIDSKSGHEQASFIAARLK